MTYAKWGFRALLLVAVAALLHYSLPARDVVRITHQEVKRQDQTILTDDGREQVQTRDVSFIYVVGTDGREREYRNEDTDLGWPPYFKFNTANVASRAANLQSTAENPKWVVITHYGWRIQVFSMFPNIVGIRPADSPDEPLFPWFNISVLGGLLALVLVIRWQMRRFYDRHVDPLVDAAGESFDAASDAVDEHYRGVSGWLRRLRGR
ncbi:MAG: DUF1523 family protein [Paracoccaceae bacterium]